MNVSVVIATYNRSGELRTCLLRLARQRFQPGDEVVVADNASTDDTQEVLRQISAGFPVPLLTVLEPKPGKTHAVHRALGSCRGDIIAFTDDDVLVGEDWIERIKEVFADGRVDLAGGRVLPNFAGPVPAWLDLSGGEGFGRLASPLGLADYGPTRQPLGTRSALGGNLVVRRAALDAVGGFPRDLGKLRGTLLSGEDHALSERMVGSGYEAIYDPAMLVHHLVPASRLRFRYFIRWF
ncbi:MAG TPA: glycosyltransferase, partial [Vicinamibacterales bacterium]|nr:glycosyltransferase [Vicinamibacterales bacterium]